MAKRIFGIITMPGSMGGCSEVVPKSIFPVRIHVYFFFDMLAVEKKIKVKLMKRLTR